MIAYLGRAAGPEDGRQRGQYKAPRVEKVLVYPEHSRREWNSLNLGRSNLPRILAEMQKPWQKPDRQLTAR
jgi:hypothetical protein